MREDRENLSVSSLKTGTVSLVLVSVSAWSVTATQEMLGVQGKEERAPGSQEDAGRTWASVAFPACFRSVPYSVFKLASWRQKLC